MSVIRFCKVCLFLILISSTLIGKQVECQRLHEILPLIDEDTLVVFNINNVLTCSAQDAGSTPWAEEHIARISAEKNLTKPHAMNQFIPLWHEILIASDVELFDPDAEAIIRYLQSNNIKTMALTNRYVEMAYPTHQQLKSVGIDFAKNAPFSEDFFIQGIQSPAKYIEGIIFNGLINFKGDSLVAFLKQIQYTPSKVIYIEDKLKHLTQVEQALTVLGIPFIGVNFGALELQRQKYQSKLAALQVQYHFDILDDLSAERLHCHRTGQSKKLAMQEIEDPVLSSSIRKIESLDEIKPDLIPRALVVTELDHVLWKTQGSIGSRAFLEHQNQKYLALGNSPQCARVKAERLVEKIHRRAQVKLIDEKSVSFFHELASRNCWSVGMSFRPKRLFQRTTEQATQLKLFFRSPFKNGSAFHSQGIICASQPNGQFKELSENLSQMTLRPSLLIGISAELTDLTQLQEIAASQNLKFLGYLYRPQNASKTVMDDEILALELEYLDHLLTNEDADILLNHAMCEPVAQST